MILLTAAALAALSRGPEGWLDHDATVASYSPEFARGGKKGVTVRRLLSRRGQLGPVATVDNRRSPAFTPAFEHNATQR